MKTPKIIEPAKATIYLMGLLILVPLNVWSQTPATTGKGTLKIRVIYDDNERPVRRAEVSLQSEELPPIWRHNVTDTKGEVLLNNVPAGSYTITVGFAGVMNGSAGFSSKSSTTVDGSSRSELTIRAKRGGSLTGKITYPDGEPVIGAKVSALIKRGKRWQGFSQPAATDDRGIYRIYPLARGEYIVSAFEEGVVITELPEGGSSHSTSNMSVSAYYYGGVSFKTAQVIQLDAGRELGNINITLTERALFKLSGTVMGAGVPLPGATLSLRVRDDGDGENPAAGYYMGVHTRADSKGAWVFGNVPEGSYYLELVSEQLSNDRSSSGRVPRRFAWQPYPINVTSGDVENIAFSAEEGARMSGTVIVEGDKPVPRGEVFLRPNTGVRWPYWRDSIQLELGSKGQFRLDGVAAGDHFVSMNVWDRDYYVKSITWNDRDLLRFPLTVSEGSDATGIRIVVATDVSIVSGRLVYADNKPVGPNLILLIPVDESLWNVSNFRFGYTDKKGNFTYRGAPGEFGLVVVQRGEEPNTSFNYVREQMTRAPRINLKPGEQDLKEIIVRTP